jgi:hypothetical protein
MKFTQLKRKLRTEEYNIPDVLSKIKDNLPTVLKQPSRRKPKLAYRYAISFSSLFVFILVAIFAIAIPTVKNEASGPENISHFSSDEEITSTVRRFNKQKEAYIDKEAAFFETYSMNDIPDLPDTRIYYSDNQVAKAYKDKVYYLNNKGLLVFDVASDNITKIYEKELNFDTSENVKTLDIVNDKLIIIYKSSEYVNVVIYDINNMDDAYVYKIRSTYITSQIHDNKLFLVTILNDRKLPMIEVNYRPSVKKPTDVGYLENIVGESYTILTKIDLDTKKQKETIFLSFNKWDIVYFSGDNLYLLNNHMNYKKTLEYGEYTTIVKFKDEAEGFTYQGSYTIKGSVPDKSNVYEYENNFRVVLQVTHYKVKKVFLFFTKIVEVNRSINIVNFSSNTINNKPILSLTTSYQITETIEDDNDSAKRIADQSISIVSTKFFNDKIAIETRGMKTKVNYIHVLDPYHIIKVDDFGKYEDWHKLQGDIIALDKDYGFSLRAIKTSTGEFEIRFYDLSTNEPVEVKENYAYLNYSYLLEDADYIIVDAIQYTNSLYIASDENNYYIGFAVTNNLYKTYINDPRKTPVGTYTLITIDKVTKKAKFQDLTSNNIIIEKIVGTNTDVVYGLAHKNIVQFSLNQYNNFVKTKTQEFEYNKK